MIKREELTPEQVIVYKVLESLTASAEYNSYDIKKFVSNFVQRKKEEYKIPEFIVTLRQYLTEHSYGAYHHFKFIIMYTEINVTGVEDFERLYNKDILDQYEVIEDKETDNNGDCTNYCCEHRLTLRRAEK